MSTVRGLFGGNVHVVAREAKRNGTTMKALSWSITSNLDMGPDQWEVFSGDVQDFLTAAKGDKITLRVGYVTPEGAPILVGQIVDGPLDDWGLVINPNQMKVRLSGKDQLIEALNRSFQKRYLREAPPPLSQGQIIGNVNGPINAQVNGTISGTINALVNGTVNFNLAGTLNGTPINGLVTGVVNGQVVGAISGTIDGTVSGTINANVNWTTGAPSTGGVTQIPTSNVPFAVGSFTASAIARELAASVNLPLSWQAPDYELQADYEVSGRIMDTLVSLAEPFSRPDPFHVDVFLRGGTIFVKQRDPSPTADPENVIAVGDARIANFDMREKTPLKFGKVHLEGRSVAGASTGTSGADPTLMLEPFSSTTLDDAGRTTATVFGSRLMRKPENLMLREVKTTFAAIAPSSGESLSPSTGGGVVSQETTTVTYVDEHGILILDERRSQGTPRLAREVKSIETPDKKTGTLQESERQEKSCAYDDDRLLTTETTLTLKRNKKDELAPSTKSVRSLNDAGPGLIRETADRYAVKKSTGDLTLSNSETRVQGGTRPGGTGKAGGGLGSSGGAKVTVEEVLSTDQDAQDVSYSNDQLNEAALRTILAQYKKAQGMREEEVRYVVYGMPWILRGSIMHYTGLKGPGGETIDLPATIATQLRIEVNEETAAAVYRTNAAATGWRAPEA